MELSRFETWVNERWLIALILVLLAATVGYMAQDGHAYAGQGAAVEIVSGDRK